MAIILGSSIGSFLNVVIDRLPRKESIVLPSSYCITCGKKIPFYLNIPIISYIILGGKCKYCHSVIHWHHFAVELLTPLLIIGLYFIYGLESILFYKYLLLFLLLIPIFFIDLNHYLILHVLSFPLIASGIFFALFASHSNDLLSVNIINALITGAAVFIIMAGLAFYYWKIKQTDGMGGGDIWLMTALATNFGFYNIPFIILFSSILAILGYIFLLKGKNKPIPFGSYLAFTSIVWVFVGEYFLQWYMTLL